MAFDKQTAGQPIVCPEKRTTQVNAWVVIGIAVFLLLGALALMHVYHNPPQSQPGSLSAAKSG